MTELIEKLGNRKISDEELLGIVKKDFTLIPKILNGVSSENPRIKFGCAKILSKFSEDDPEVLYSEIDFFINQLNNNNNIIKWNAMNVIANLTRVDKDKRFDEIFARYYELLNEDGMVTVAHVIDNSGKIALAKPYLTEKITNELLKLEKLPTKPKVTVECKNILYGKVIIAFDQYYNQIDNKDEVISFARRLLQNTRNATKSKAEKFLKKIET